MTEDHDSRISDLYRLTSQETPPAHIDRALMGMARKSVRRRLWSPFGNHWVAGGALAGVLVLSVLLIPDVLQQPDHYAPGQDAVAPSSETLPETRKETAQRRVSPSELPAESEAKREVPAAPKARFDFYGALPDSEMIVPEVDPRVRLQQAPAAAAEEPASTTATDPAGTWYLQVGSFREKNSADEFKAKLTELGYKCEVHEVSITDTDVYHRVRVGPFVDNDALKQSKRKLGEAGIEAYEVRVEE
jgi:cell division protein FtsN